MPRSLPPKPKKLDELSFHDFMRRVPVAEFKRQWVPEPVRLPNKYRRWHAKYSLGDPNMQYFRIPSEISKNSYAFLTRVDWRGLFVPLVLAPPDLPADPTYQEYCEFAKPDELAGHGEIMAVANKLVTDYERAEWSRNNPNAEPFHKFWVQDHKRRQVPFLTRPGWRGIWVHEIIALDGMAVEPQKPTYRVYKTAEEIRGERAIRLESRKYLARREGVSTQTTDRPRKVPIRVSLTDQQQAILADIQNYLCVASNLEIDTQHTLDWIIEKSWGHLIPEEYRTVALFGTVSTGESSD